MTHWNCPLECTEVTHAREKGLNRRQQVAKEDEDWIRNRRARLGMKRRNNPLSQRQGGEDVEGGRKTKQMTKEKAAIDQRCKRCQRGRVWEKI